MGNRIFWLAAHLLLLGGALAAQPRHRILAVGNRFYLEEMATGRREPFDMWNTRLANALFDKRFTDEIIANLDDYLRYGVNTLSVGIQGGHMGSTTYNRLYPRVYNADGTLITSSPVWANLKRLLAETDRRGMVLIIQYWYFRRDQNVPTESAVLKATRNVTQWLKGTGYRHYVLDLVNEFGHPEYKGRSIFTTVKGALKLLDAVYQVDPKVLAGMSPPGRLFAPEGTVNGRWVEAKIIFSHNEPLDPTRPASYYLHGLPKNPTGKPYVNNEFNSQLRYERYPKKDPKTGKYSYGHWDQANIRLYLLDLIKLRQYGGYGNVFSHRQQYLTDPKGIPVAAVGPEGTQPESSPGAGEPSMHWLFGAIAILRRFGPLALRQDFNDGLAPGVERNLKGQWQVQGGRLVQSDAGAPLAYARMVSTTGDVEISFDAGFLRTPAATSRLGVFLGEASPQGKGYRLLVGPKTLTLDQPGGKLPRTEVSIARQGWDRYTLVCRRGRVSVRMNGRSVITLDDITPLGGANVLLLTQGAAAAFDNLRIGPSYDEDFNDLEAAPWSPADPRAWRFVRKPGTGGDMGWEVTAEGKVQHAALDLRLADFRFAFEASLESARIVGVRFRARSVAVPNDDGYLLTLSRDGLVSLHVLRRGKPTLLAQSRAVFNAAGLKTALTAHGNLFTVYVNGRRVLHAVDPARSFRRGGLAIFTGRGTVLFDNLSLETGPSLEPTAGIHATNGRLVLEVRDPDGALDFRSIRLYVDKRDGQGFQDVTYAFWPRLKTLTITRTPDGKGARAESVPGLRLLGKPWTLRLTAADHAGNQVEALYDLKSGPQR